MNEWFVKRAEMLAEIAADKSQPPARRLEAADEVMLIAGEAEVRRSIERTVGHTAGCFQGQGGDCDCDLWDQLFRIIRGDVA